MICIDFGNTYTKVGIRPNSDTKSELIKDPVLSFDELNICIPTVAARVEKNSSEAWYFGNDVQQVSRSPGLSVMRNWKPEFFKGIETSLRSTQAVGAIATKGKTRLSNEDWATVRQILNLDDDHRSTIERLAGGKKKSENADGSEETSLDIKFVGLGFFKWLKDFVGPICQKYGLGAIDKIPARITLPSFGSATSSELLLRELLEEAGWKIDKKKPAMAEPLANAIGTFTEGLNATHKPKGANKVMPHYGVMFENTGLLQVIREAILADGPKVSWVLIADLGGYTLDFAMVALDLEDIDSKFEGTIDGLPKTATHSEPIGVTTLDRRIQETLPEEKAKVLESLARDPDQKRLESCHRILYGKRKGVKFRDVDIAVEGSEHRRVGNEIEEFAAELADCAQKFLEIHQYSQVDDLVLTGGGMMIPTIRNALIKKLEASYGVRKIHMHSYDATPQVVKHHGMDQRLVRGATALGGASVYFDFAE
jgi:hypothetical protein